MRAISYLTIICLTSLFLAAQRKKVIIDLDEPQSITIKELNETPFIEEFIFRLTPNQYLHQKLNKINVYLEYLSNFPTIRTSFQLKHAYQYQQPSFPVVAVGGTFDHLHLGHQVLLLYTALSAKERVYIGVTGEPLLVNKKNKFMLQPWYLRMKHVEAFVKSVKPELEVFLSELNDPFGPTITVDSMDALVISEETLKGGEKVNQKRAERGMKPLPLIICPTISTTGQVQNKLSSSFTREYLLKKNGFKIENYSEYRGFFDRLLGRLGVENKDKVENWWEIIFLRYSEHWRHYHTNLHILRLLQEWNGKSFDEKRQKLSQQEINVVQLAIFFHDVIYRPDSSTNQEDSAQLAASFVKDALQITPETDKLLKNVTQLILETNNQEPTTPLSQILYDLDMGVLNSEFKYYQEYARTIKREYQPLFGEQYPVKRAQQLKKYKESGLYFSFQPQNLQSNLSWEIQTLQNHDL